MKVLVTGAAGFIGSNLVHYLVTERPSWQIVSLDLLTYAGNLENIASLVQEKRTTFVKLDICDEKGIEDLFEKESFDIVFHLAAESHVDRSIHGAKDFVRTNVLGTQTLLDAAKKFSVKKFIHISTDEVYGSLGATGRFYETTPLDPSSPYSASKAASDLVALAFGKTHGMHVCVTRCTNNYGPYQFPEKLIPLFVTNLIENKKIPLYGDGMNVRSWLYVTDHCEAILLVGEQGQPGEVYNIGGTEEAEIPNRHVTDAILQILGKDESLIEWVADRPAHDRRYAVSIDKINNAFGWKPRIPFTEGLKKTVAWYQEQSAWWKRIKTGEYMRFYEQNYGMKR
jgi:dTDP-glucose 4,6-dehydratase